MVPEVTFFAYGICKCITFLQRPAHDLRKHEFLSLNCSLTSYGPLSPINSVLPCIKFLESRSNSIHYSIRKCGVSPNFTAHIVSHMNIYFFSSFMDDDLHLLLDPGSSPAILFFSLDAKINKTRVLLILLPLEGGGG